MRAFVHRLDDRSDRLRTLGAEVVDGDLRDFRSVAAAMGGIRRAYFAYPVQEGLLDAAATFAAAPDKATARARATIVRRTVLSVGRRAIGSRLESCSVKSAILL